LGEFIGLVEVEQRDIQNFAVFGAVAEKKKTSRRGRIFGLYIRADFVFPAAFFRDFDLGYFGLDGVALFGTEADNLAASSPSSA
jgi:hypothetical protein